MQSLKIGLLLGWRQIQRASLWTNLLIVFVMMLTFLNLIAVSGILVGLIVGAEVAVREKSLGDIIISPRDDEDHILETERFVRELSAYPEVSAYSVRYKGAGVLEANYQLRRNLSGERDIANVTVTGIDPKSEERMTALADELIAGEYLSPEDEGKILLGALYTKEYASNYGDIFETVEGVEVGDTVRLTSGSITKEFVVKGIVQSKVDEVSLNTYIPEREFRRLFNRIDRNADQVVVRLYQPNDNIKLKEAMVGSGLGNLAKIQTYEEGVPKFLTDIKNTMNLLGTFIGSIGLVVASITIFIIIFINALARRRYIGILKGIGIDQQAIECAYVVQAGIYAIVGALLGVVVTYAMLIPYFKANPINFPFSDGILVAPIEETAVRFVILLITTLIAGFIPAFMIARGNTLNAILGRKN
ncbi:MAG: ABC transporter permease [Candidatus Paceibacteria bacterium]